MSEIKARIQLRHDTSENWIRNNPVLLLCETGIETDTGREKMGDGVHNWADLPYKTYEDASEPIPLSVLYEIFNTSELDLTLNYTEPIPESVLSELFTNQKGG